MYDLTPYDSDLMTEDKKNPRYTNEELEIEKICDEERYMFLNDEINEEDDSNEGENRFMINNLNNSFNASLFR